MSRKNNLRARGSLYYSSTTYMIRMKAKWLHVVLAITMSELFIFKLFYN